MPGNALRCSWEVTAGIIPGTADDQHTKSWSMTSAEWSGPDGLKKLVETNAAAEAYALYLRIESSQGRSVNWVRVEFIWY